MLLAQVEGFLEVARRGNVSRAAEAMFVTQPTLTARLHALERELGEPLFARTRRGMKLTDAGRAFLPYAERAMRAVRDGRQALADPRSASAGRLVLGAAPAGSTYVLPALLQRFAGACPRVEVAVRTGHSEDVLQMLLREEVQLAMVRALRHPDIESIPLYEEALVLVVPPGHSFAERSNVELLRAHPGVLPQPGRHPARGDGAGQHRVGQEDGAATPWHRVAATHGGRG